MAERQRFSGCQSVGHQGQSGVKTTAESVRQQTERFGVAPQLRQYFRPGHSTAACHHGTTHRVVGEYRLRTFEVADHREGHGLVVHGETAQAVLR